MENRLKINIFGIKFSIVAPWNKYGNKVTLIKNNIIKNIKNIKGCKTKFYGSNSIVEFSDKVPKMNNVVIHLGNNCKVLFGKSAHRIKNLFINMRADNCMLMIGKDFSIESGKIDYHGEPNLKIEIGDDCLFGSNIEIDPSDGHTIYDCVSRQQLNKPQNIFIGNHVWLCRNVSVLKGAIISNNSVVGKNSVVTSKFNTSNVIIAGIPAKIIQSEKYQNINWSREANKNFF